jgi:uncharacterized protein YjbI with pentapeptide repeats
MDLRITTMSGKFSKRGARWPFVYAFLWLCLAIISSWAATSKGPSQVPLLPIKDPSTYRVAQDLYQEVKSLTKNSNFTTPNLSSPTVDGNLTLSNGCIGFPDGHYQCAGVNDVKEFGAKGNGIDDDTNAIQNAVNRMQNGQILFFPNGIYLISTNVVVSGFSGIRILGQGEGTQITWNTTSSSTTAMFLWRWTAYSEMAYLTLTGGNDINHYPGIGIYVTSLGFQGPNITSYNHFHDISVRGTLIADLQIGSGTNNDINMDGNRVDNCSFGYSNLANVRIFDANTTHTIITRSVMQNALFYGVEIGANTKGVTLDSNNLSNPGTYYFFIHREQASWISIRDMEFELSAGNATFLYAEPTLGGVQNVATLELENIQMTNAVDGFQRIIDYEGNGTVFMKNVQIAGPTIGPPLTGSSGELLFNPPTSGSPGQNQLVTSNVYLYQGAHFNVRTTTPNPMHWLDLGTTYAQGLSSSSVIPSVSLYQTNLNNQLMSFVNPGGVTTMSIGSVGRQTARVQLSTSAFITAGTTSYVYVITTPPKARIVGVVADTTVPYSGLSGTITLGVGSIGAQRDLLLDHDVKTAAVTKGLADADLGTSLARATAVEGGVLYWPGTQVFVALVSGTGNIGNGTVSNLTAGQTDLYVTTEILY